MTLQIKQLLIRFLYLCKIDVLFEKMESLMKTVSLYRLNKKLPSKLTFVYDGGGGFFVTGDLKKFSIGEGSYIKSGTYIECSGGVSVGKYCHLSRGLTIFSSTHDYDGRTKIPYDEIVTLRPVAIKDFVWVASNVIIMGGVTVGEGAIIGAGSVVRKDVPEYSIVAGNPARIIGQRDIEHFNKLKEEGKFF